MIGKALQTVLKVHTKAADAILYRRDTTYKMLAVHSPRYSSL